MWKWGLDQGRYRTGYPCMRNVLQLSKPSKESLSGMEGDG